MTVFGRSVLEKHKDGFPCPTKQIYFIKQRTLENPTLTLSSMDDLKIQNPSLDTLTATRGFGKLSSKGVYVAESDLE